jgi:hypothetical protein
MAGKAKSQKTTGIRSVYNRATGEHQAPATQKSATAWWKRKLGMGSGDEAGALAKRRKASVESNIDAADG